MKTNLYKVEFKIRRPDKLTAGKYTELEYSWNVGAESVMAAKEIVVEKTADKGDIIFTEISLQEEG